MMYEFIEELRFELCKKDVNDMEDVLSYFEEMIKDRMENGEEIEDILADLGDPKRIADTLFGDQVEGKVPEKKAETPAQTASFTGVKKIETETQVARLIGRENRIGAKRLGINQVVVIRRTKPVVAQECLVSVRNVTVGVDIGVILITLISLFRKPSARKNLTVTA